MKKNSEEKQKRPARKIAEKALPEKYWKSLFNTYAVFYSRCFKDQDGYPLRPVWNDATRGMEGSGLKKIITRLRTIAEQKNIEWSEGYANDCLHNFLQKAANDPFIRKSMMCCQMAKYADTIISSEYTPSLVNQVLSCWYQLFPDYTKDQERDKTAAQITIGFLKQQYLQSGLEFTDKSVMQSVRTIFSHVSKHDWWSKKTLRTIANNLQEFVTEIKYKKNATASQIRGNDYSRGFENRNSSPDNKKDFGRL